MPGWKMRCGWCWICKEPSIRIRTHHTQIISYSTFDVLFHLTNNNTKYARIHKQKVTERKKWPKLRLCQKKCARSISLQFKIWYDIMWMLYGMIGRRKKWLFANIYLYSVWNKYSILMAIDGQRRARASWTKSSYVWHTRSFPHS